MKKNKKSFWEQLEYLLFERKLLNTKTGLAFTAIIGVIAISGVMISLKSPRPMVEEGDVEYTEDLRVDALEEYGFSKPEIEQMDEDRKIDLSNKILIQYRNQVAGDEWKEEFPISSHSDLKTKYYKLAFIGDYQGIVEDFETLKLKYYFSTPYNKKIIKIYNDAYMLKSAFADKNNIVQQKDTLSKIKDERMLLSAMLQSSLEIRNSSIIDRMSLTFSSEDDVIKINSVTSGSMAYMAENEMHLKDANILKVFEYLVEGDYIIYKINFNLGVDKFNAYMFKEVGDPSLSLFGIYAENSANLSNVYNTIAEATEILSMMENYNSTDNINVNTNTNNIDTGVNVDTDINSDADINNVDTSVDNIDAPVEEEYDYSEFQ